MVVFFGAPVTYENNTARAVEFALVLKQELAALSASARHTFQYRMGADGRYGLYRYRRGQGARSVRLRGQPGQPGGPHHGRGGMEGGIGR